MPRARARTVDGAAYAALLAALVVSGVAVGPLQRGRGSKGKCDFTLQWGLRPRRKVLLPLPEALVRSRGRSSSTKGS